MCVRVLMWERVCASVRERGFACEFVSVHETKNVCVYV